MESNIAMHYFNVLRLESFNICSKIFNISLVVLQDRKLTNCLDGDHNLQIEWLEPCRSDHRYIRYFYCIYSLILHSIHIFALLRIVTFPSSSVAHATFYISASITCLEVRGKASEKGCGSLHVRISWCAEHLYRTKQEEAFRWLKLLCRKYERGESKAGYTH